MKKVIKPSPVMLLIYAIITGVLAFIVIIDIDGGEGYAMVLPCIASGVMFIFYLLRYILRGRVYFDDDTFTVYGKTYNFSQISRAVTGYEIVGVLPRLFSRRRRLFSLHREDKIEIYVKGEYVFSFTFDEPGAKEFAAMLKKHRVKFRIKNSLKDWEGVIE